MTQHVTAGMRMRASEVLRADGFTLAEVHELLSEPRGLRDEFAIAALQVVTTPVFLEALKRSVGPDKIMLAVTTEAAYDLANAMMAERSKRVGGAA